MSHNDQSDGVEASAQPQPTLCSNGCGFFANAGTSGMCSKCYRQTEQAQQTLDAVTQKAVAAVAQKAAAAATQGATVEKMVPATVEKTLETAFASGAVSGVLNTASPETSSAAAPPPPPSSGPCRCNVGGCKKKLGLTGFTCRCGLTFCGQHRMAESHSCSYDYKTFERLKIADNNPVVQASKIQKI